MSNNTAEVALPTVPQDDRIHAEQVRMLYTQTPPAMLVSVGVALIVTLVLWKVAPQGLLALWLGTLVTINAARGAVYLAYTRQHPDAIVYRDWGRIFLVGAFFSGASWGALGLMLDVSWPISYQLILYVALMGVASGGLASNAVLFKAYVAFMVPVTAPLALMLAGRSEQMYLSMTALVGLYMVMLIATARGYQRNVLHALALREQKSELLDSLSLTNKGLQQEIHERERAEQNLKKEKDKAQVTLHSIGDGVITTDVAGRIEYLNPLAEQLTGWTSELARNMPLDQVFQVVASDSGKPLANPVASCLRRREVVVGRGHDTLTRRDGTKYAITHTAAPIREPSGEALGAVLVFQDVTHMRDLTDKLAFHATHDPLTGLINRWEFEQHLHRSLEAAKTAGKEHVLLYMDLDQFKIVNDTCGHQAGDELLRQLASSILPAKLRGSDTLGRLGGDEFGVLLEFCPLDKGLAIAEKLRKAIKDFRFTWEDKAFDIGVTIGAVSIDARSGGVNALLSAADVACYAAKDLGRNRVHAYEESDMGLARREGEMRWISRISHALSNGRLELFHQEIVPVEPSDEEPRHVEILIRMRDEAGNLVPPNAFLPAAERYNLMPDVDRWVVKRCFAWYSRHAAENLVCSINLSGTSLSDATFLDFILAQFNTSGLPTSAICFEITETAAVADLATASHFIKELRAIGCRFSLDDFGSGLSSFGYLKNLPVDYLKIDGSFVRNMATDPLDRAMVDAINTIGHVMGKKTIAEFVEDEAILAELAAIGVDYAQGYGIARPAPLQQWTPKPLRGG